MSLRNSKIVFPWFPFSVLVFYIGLMILWNFNLIPTPDEILVVVEGLDSAYSILGVFIAAFLECLAFIGHEFPGVTLIFIAIIVGEKSLAFLATMVLVITIAFTLSSLVNYWAGTFFSKRVKEKSENKNPKKTLLLSLTHPAFLSLYFFHAGMQRRGLKELVFVPIFTFPYILIIGFMLTLFSDFVRSLLSSDLFFLVVFIGWFLVEFYMKNKVLVKKRLGMK